MATALNRFISRSADRCRPFFQLINKWKGFEWSTECDVAFQRLKDYLARPPVMSSPELDEVLFAYIAVASYAVSLVLIRVDNGVRGGSALPSTGKSHLGSGAWHTQVASLFPSTYGDCSYTTPTKECT